MPPNHTVASRQLPSGVERSHDASSTELVDSWSLQKILRLRLAFPGASDRRPQRLEHSYHRLGVAFAGAYFLNDGRIFAHWEDSTNPAQLIELDSKTGAHVGTILVPGDVPASRAWESVTLASSNQSSIQGWLAVPDGDGPFPTILETHGGLHSAKTDEYSPQSQAWLDRGYAYLTINYRGSATFGRDFMEQIWGHLGELEVEDMVAARKWLVDRGIARPDEVMLTGWSYGGYLTLLALGRRPDLWAGGMAGIAISDWATQYEDSADTLRAFIVALFGGEPHEVPERYAASSPITNAADVSAPVLIIQGRNDTRTPARPIENYEELLRKLGKSIEVHWFDSGHLGSFADVELSVAHHELMMDFADKTLASSN